MMGRPFTDMSCLYYKKHPAVAPHILLFKAATIGCDAFAYL